MSRLRATTGFCVTNTLATSALPPLAVVTTIVALPAFLGVNTPLLFTLTTSGAELAQINDVDAVSGVTLGVTMVEEDAERGSRRGSGDNPEYPYP
jgi:hypothetical protein